MANPVLLGSREVCQRLDIDKSTLTRWVTAGRIERAQKLPGANGASLFDAAEVERVRAKLANEADATASAGAA